MYEYWYVASIVCALHVRVLVCVCVCVLWTIPNENSIICFCSSNIWITEILLNRHENTRTANKTPFYTCAKKEEKWKILKWLSMECALSILQQQQQQKIHRRNELSIHWITSIYIILYLSICRLAIWWVFNEYKQLRLLMTVMWFHWIYTSYAHQKSIQ